MPVTTSRVLVRARITFCIALSTSLAAPPLPIARADNAKRACVAASTEGQTLRKEDKLLEAREKLRICATDPCPSIVKTHCTRWLGELEAQIPSAIVRAKDAAGGDVLDAEVTIDGKPSALGRPETVDPGEHVVTVTRTGGARVEKKFLLVDGEKGRILTVELPATGAPPATPSATSSAAAGADGAGATGEAPPVHGKHLPAGAWVLGGVGLVALGTSAFFAIQTSNDLTSLRQSCGHSCTDAQTSDGRTHALITDVSLGVGVATVVGAIAWAVFGRSDGSTRPGSAAATVEVRPVAGGALGTVGVRF